MTPRLTDLRYIAAIALLSLLVALAPTLPVGAQDAQPGDSDAAASADDPAAADDEAQAQAPVVAVDDLTPEQWQALASKVGHSVEFLQARVDPGHDAWTLLQQRCDAIAAEHNVLIELSPRSRIRRVAASSPEQARLSAEVLILWGEYVVLETRLEGTRSQRPDQDLSEDERVALQVELEELEFQIDDRNRRLSGLRGRPDRGAERVFHGYSVTVKSAVYCQVPFAVSDRRLEVVLAELLADCGVYYSVSMETGRVVSARMPTSSVFSIANTVLAPHGMRLGWRRPSAGRTSLTITSGSRTPSQDEARVSSDGTLSVNPAWVNDIDEMIAYVEQAAEMVSNVIWTPTSPRPPGR